MTGGQAVQPQGPKLGSPVATVQPWPSSLGTRRLGADGKGHGVAQGTAGEVAMAIRGCVFPQDPE